MNKYFWAFMFVLLISPTLFALDVNVVSEKHGLINNELILDFTNPGASEVIKSYDFNLFFDEGYFNNPKVYYQRATDSTSTRFDWVRQDCSNTAYDSNGDFYYCLKQGNKFDYFCQSDVECYTNEKTAFYDPVTIYSWIELNVTLDGNTVHFPAYNFPAGETIRIKVEWNNLLTNETWGSKGRWKINPENWWDAGWDYRAPLTVTDNNASGDTVAGTVSRLTSDTSTLIGAGKMQADCDDIRIIYTDNTDLNVSHEGCNTAYTNIYFMTQNTISGSDSTNYEVYYGNAGASATTGVFQPSFNLTFTGSAPDSWTEGGSATWNFSNNYAETITNNNAGWYYGSFDREFRAVEFCFEADVKRSSSANVTLGRASGDEDSGGYYGHTPDDLLGYMLVGGTSGQAGLYSKGTGAPGSIVAFADMTAGTSYNLKACRSRNGVWEAWQDSVSKGTGSENTYYTFSIPQFFLDQGTGANAIDDFILSCDHYCWGDIFPSVAGGVEESGVTLYAPDVNIVSPNGGEYYDNRTTTNVTVSFNVQDSDGNSLLIDLNYSASATEGTGTAILIDENTSGGSIVCDDADFTDSTNCEYSWNIDAVADGNYYLIIRADDDSDFNTDASDSDFNIWTSVVPVTPTPDTNSSYTQQYINPKSNRRDGNVFFSEDSRRALTDEEKTRIATEQTQNLIFIFGLIVIVILICLGVILWKKK